MKDKKNVSKKRKQKKNTKDQAATKGEKKINYDALTDVIEIQQMIFEAEAKGHEKRTKKLRKRLKVLAKTPHLSHSEGLTKADGNGTPADGSGENAPSNATSRKDENDAGSQDGRSRVVRATDAPAAKKRKLAVARSANTKGDDGDGGEVSSSVPEHDAKFDEHMAVGEDSEDAKNDVTILLFYQYVRPVWSKEEWDTVMKEAYDVLKKNGCTGRLRVAREGLNATLAGPYDGIRAFTQWLKDHPGGHFTETDFKYVDGLPRSQLLKGLKVFPVTELVTYGVSAGEAHITNGGTHLTAEDYHKKMEEDPSNTVMIDVRNYNESLIGKFSPPGVKVLDPEMRRSTEFPEWVDNNMSELKGKNVLMYCTGGIRCERASALLVEKGLTNIYQLEGGIHRYLEKYKTDGGHWVGKNYTFDKRFSHGADQATVISKCVHCGDPWERYQAKKKCCVCHMEVLVCKPCMRSDNPPKRHQLKCPLCKAGKLPPKEVYVPLARRSVGGGRGGIGRGRGRGQGRGGQGGRGSARGGRVGFSR